MPAGSRMPFRPRSTPTEVAAHACTYCFARPTHEYLGLDIGEDFERRIVVKVNAVERLRAELADPRWAGRADRDGDEHRSLPAGRGPLPARPRGWSANCPAARNPFSILTKSSMILRDLDLLVEAARRTRVSVSLSIGTDDDEIGRLTEPGAPPPSKRLEAVARLAEAGAAPGGAGRAGAAGHLGRRGAAAVGGPGLCRGRRGQRHAADAASAARCSRALPGLAGRRAAGAGRRPRGPLPAGLPPAGRGRAGAGDRQRSLPRRSRLSA